MHIYIGGNGWGLTILLGLARRWGIEIWFLGDRVQFLRKWVYCGR
jgi:hypothetical protein